VSLGPSNSLSAPEQSLDYLNTHIREMYIKITARIFIYLGAARLIYRANCLGARHGRQFWYPSERYLWAAGFVCVKWEVEPRHATRWGFLYTPIINIRTAAAAGFLCSWFMPHPWKRPEIKRAHPPKIGWINHWWCVFGAAATRVMRFWSMSNVCWKITSFVVDDTRSFLSTKIYK